MERKYKKPVDLEKLKEKIRKEEKYQNKLQNKEIYSFKFNSDLSWKPSQINKMENLINLSKERVQKLEIELQEFAKSK